MSKAMIDIIEKTIHEDYYLSKKNRDWLLDNNVKLRAPDRNSLGFSLDNEQRPPFVFFKGDLPAHMAKMCDAIIALYFKRRLYLFIIEQKTANSGQYKKQLANGRCFCDWLFSLYKEHEYCSDDPVYIGLLIWHPRTSSRKGKTAHKSTPRPKTHHRFKHFFEEKNNRNIYLQKFIESL